MTLQASSHVRVFSQPVQFVIGGRFRDGLAGHRQRLQTQLLGPFLTTQLRPEDVLPADMGQESVDEANRFEVPGGKEGEDMKDHCARQYTALYSDKGSLAVHSMGSCDAKSTGLRYRILRVTIAMSTVGRLRLGGGDPL